MTLKVNIIFFYSFSAFFRLFRISHWIHALHWLHRSRTPLMEIWYKRRIGFMGYVITTFRRYIMLCVLYAVYEDAARSLWDAKQIETNRFFALSKYCHLESRLNIYFYLYVYSLSDMILIGDTVNKQIGRSGVNVCIFDSNIEWWN